MSTARQASIRWLHGIYEPIACEHTAIDATQSLHDIVAQVPHNVYQYCASSLSSNCRFGVGEIAARRTRRFRIGVFVLFGLTNALVAVVWSILVSQRRVRQRDALRQSSTMYGSIDNCAVVRDSFVLYLIRTRLCYLNYDDDDDDRSNGARRCYAAARFLGAGRVARGRRTALQHRLDLQHRRCLGREVNRVCR